MNNYILIFTLKKQCSLKLLPWQIQLLQQLNTNVALNQSIDEIFMQPQFFKANLAQSNLNK
jgi:hypothetical protein